MNTISREQARRILLHNQLLAEKRSLNALEAAEHLVAIQAQYSTSPAQALLARSTMTQVAEYQRLCKRGAMRKGWNLRRTLHAYPESLREIITNSVGHVHRRGYLRSMAKDRFGQYDESALLEISELIREALQDGPISRKDLHERVPALKQMGWTGWGADVMPLSFAGEVVHVGGNAPIFARLHPPEGREHDEAVKDLAEGYLRSCGPASLSDFAFWTGLSRAQCQKGFELAASEAIRVQVEGDRVPYYLHHNSPIEPEIRAGIRLLPKFDPYVLAYKDKSRVMSDALVPRVVRIAGQIEAVILVDGVPAGVWRLQSQGTKARFIASMLRKPSDRTWQRIGNAAERLVKAHGLTLDSTEVQDF